MCQRSSRVTRIMVINGLGDGLLTIHYASISMIQQDSVVSKPHFFILCCIYLRLTQSTYIDTSEVSFEIVLHSLIIYSAFYLPNKLMIKHPTQFLAALVKPLSYKSKRKKKNHWCHSNIPNYEGFLKLGFFKLIRIWRQIAD